ncbi:hypothetical protein ACDX78_13425 [Virgibacillus oceani]
MYRDPSPITPTNPEYDKSKIDPRVANYTKQVREKQHGIATREAMARAEEISSIVSREAKISAEAAYEITQNLLDEAFDSSLINENFEQRLDETIRNLQPEWTGFKDDVTSQLMQAETNLNERSINVMQPPVPLSQPAADGVTDDTNALQTISDYARDNGLSLYMPNYDYKINGTVKCYTSITCSGNIILNTNDNGYAFEFMSNKPKVDIDADSLTGLYEGSTKVEGLPAERGATWIIRSNERLIKRNNPTNPEYQKAEASVLIDNEGGIYPPLDTTYSDKSGIFECYFIEKEDHVLTIEGFNFIYNGEEKADRRAMLINRSDVLLRDINIINKTNLGIATMIRTVDAANVFFENVKGSGANPDDLGYGISVGRSCNIRFNNCEITDCRHAITGRHAKNVIIDGGIYSDIDSHWGNNYIIKNLTVIGLIQFAGKDIKIDNIKSYTGSAILSIRHDTPSLRGVVVIKNVEAYLTSGFNRFDIIYRHIQDGFDWEEVISSPESVLIDNIKMDSAGQPIHVIRNAYPVPSIPMERFKNVLIKNVKSVDNATINVTTFLSKRDSYTDKLNLQLESIENVLLYGLDETELESEEDSISFEVINCTGVDIIMHPTLVDSGKIIGSHIIRFESQGEMNKDAGVVTFRNSLINGPFRGGNPMKIYNSEFDGVPSPTDIVEDLTLIGQGNVISRSGGGYNGLLFLREYYVDSEYYR